jgi:(p)ppGpp synthase/HD superfamily hydrolase
VTGNKLSRLTAIPDFAQGSRLREEAYELAVDAHHGARRRSDTDIDHPAAVGRLLDEQGFDDEVVAAALLHDVVEDTDTDLEEIGERFGAGVYELVCVMTEDASIEPYEDRKAQHRARVAGHSSRAAAIYAADKLAKTSALRHDGGPISETKLHHYRQTLMELREAYPELPFLDRLEEELRALDAGREHASRR